MLIRIISSCTLRAAAMDMDRRDWDCHFRVKGWGNDEFLPSLGGNDTYYSILDLVYWLHGAVLIYGSSLIEVGICFYAPTMAIINIFRRALWVDWIVDDSATMDLVTSSGILEQLDGTHDDDVNEVVLSALSREPSSIVTSTEWNTNDHSDFQLVQAGVFHLNCILRCAHQFTFSPHTQDLTMSLMAWEGELSECLDLHWYDTLMATNDESKFGKSLTLFSPASCLQKQVFKIWFEWTLEVIGVVQRQNGGLRGYWSSATSEWWPYSLC